MVILKNLFLKYGEIKILEKKRFGINSRQDNQEFVATENIIEYGQWIHVAGVYDGDSLKIYIDGQKHVAELADVTFNNYNNSLFIGKAQQ